VEGERGVREIDRDRISRIADERADIVICAHDAKIDRREAVDARIKNREKYPLPER
jgi:hypothetical protein